jgi:hypothetical protein
MINMISFLPPLLLAVQHINDAILLPPEALLALQREYNRYHNIFSLVAVTYGL